MIRILEGDALTELRGLPSESCDCCVTSPPYYQLRDYGAAGQIGLEPTVEEYIAKLVDVFREVRRVLKPDGTLWLNIGDSYAGSGKGSARYPENAKKYKQGTNKGLLGHNLISTPLNGCKPKDLLGVPWMLAFALRADGWYLRQDIIWAKSNPMLESVTDRCTKAHEYIFLLSKSRAYYFDYEAIMEPATGNNNKPPAGSKDTLRPNSRLRSEQPEKKIEKRRKRDVWTVASTGGKEHHTTYPSQLVAPCILAGSRGGGTVLDPFAGSGTTGKVAQQYGRNAVLIEIATTYAENLRKNFNQ